MLFNFGRTDQVNVAAIRRLIGSLFRFLPQEEIEVIRSSTGKDDSLTFLRLQELGGTWFLDGMWERLEIDQTIKGLLLKRNYDIPLERLLFAMVANRASSPSRKLYLQHWFTNEVYIEDLSEVEIHQLYRAMDFLIEANEDI